MRRFADTLRDILLRINQLRADSYEGGSGLDYISLSRREKAAAKANRGR